MLIYSCVGITFIVWVAIYLLYFREEITAWFNNHFGKDHHEVSAGDEQAESQLPFNYTSSPKDDAP